jgi:hypothetical protein
MRNRQFIMQCVYIELLMGECCSFNYVRPFGTAFEDTIRRQSPSPPHDATGDQWIGTSAKSGLWDGQTDANGLRG